LQWAIGLSGAEVSEQADAIVPSPGETIRVCPYVEDFSGGFGRTVAMLAVVAAGVWTAGAVNSLLMTQGVLHMNSAMFAAGSAGWAGAIAAGGVVIAGGLAVNALMPPASPDTGGFDEGEPSETSPSYAYNPAANPAMNGGCVPVVYGRTKVTPYLIARHVTTEGDNQFINFLFLVAGHELDDITSITADGNPVSELGIIKTRLGEPGQSVIDEFADVIREKAAGEQIEYDDWTHPVRSDGDGLEALGVGLRCPALFYMNDSGHIVDTTVRVRVQYRQVGQTGWSDLKTVVIRDGKQGAVRRYARVDHIQRGAYEVRAKFAERPPSSERYSNDCYLEYIQEIAYDDFAYPGCSLLAWTRVPAEEISSSTPRVECVAVRETCHGGHPADNPAWAARDMLVNRDYGGSVDPALVLPSVDEWAAECAGLGLHFNTVFDEAVSLPKALDRAGQIGRGQIVLRGTKFSAVRNSPGEMRGVFCVGNIVADSFSEEFLPLEERANVIEVTYWDAERDYERITLPVRSKEWAQSEEAERSCAIALYGCTSRDEAIRHAVHRLNMNRALQRTITFETGQAGLAHEVGDIIGIQHDVPQWGYGGRVVDAGEDWIVLDSAPPAEFGWHILVVRQNGQREERIITEVEPQDEARGTRLTVAQPWDTIPGRYDLWTVGATQRTTVKPFRIASITRGVAQPVRMTCLEYVDLPEEGEVIAPEEDSYLLPVAGLDVSTQKIKVEGLEKLVLDMSWRGACSLWRVYYRTYGQETWTYVGQTSTPSTRIYNLVEQRIYQISVTAYDVEPASGEVVSVWFPAGIVPEGCEEVEEYDFETGELMLVLEDGEQVYELVEVGV
jgi:predicted phage tail protein